MPPRTTKRPAGGSSTTAPPAPATPDPTVPITITWTLAEMPSAQHRAGLAGLVIMVDYTKRFPLPEGAVLDLTTCDDLGCSLSINHGGVAALLDRTYRASLEETAVDKPWKNAKTKKEKPAKRTEIRVTTDDKGKQKEKTVFIYDIVVPHGGPLGEWAPTDDGGRWLKLWRDWLWNTLRAIPKQRLPYEQRAGASVESPDDDEEDGDSPTKDIAVAWTNVALGGGIKQASTYYLGAMDANAESVPFRDRGRYQFLLHFWPFAIHLFVPQTLNAKGERDTDGFATCIPEVARLATFVRLHEQTMRQRRPEAAGFRPRQAMIDLPDAAALWVEQWLDDALGPALQDEAAPACGGYFVIHAAKDGNSVRIRSSRMITPTRKSCLSAAVAQDLWTHLAKKQVLTNILNEHDWWRGFDRLAMTWPKDRTILDPHFRHDARVLFDHFHPSPATPTESTMPATSPPSTPPAERPPRPLEPLILHVVQSWIAGRMKAKYDLDYRSVREEQRKDFEEKKSKLATEAFLAARSRPGREFARWFTATLCSVNQRLSEDEFVALAKALETNPDHIRSITLLALSARG